MDTITEAQLMLLQGGSLAKTYQPQVNSLALVASAPAYTSKCLELLASVDLDTQFLKTSQGCLLETQVGGSQNFSMTWPRSGLMQSGIVSKLPTLAHRIDATECGLLPTLGKNEGKGASRKRYVGSDHFRGAKMAEGLRTCPTDQIYTHPNFAEAAMGFPRGWTDLQD